MDSLLDKPANFPAHDASRGRLWMCESPWGVELVFVCWRGGVAAR